MREVIMEDQDELITHKSDSEDVASEANNKAILEHIVDGRYILLVYNVLHTTHYVDSRYTS